jgi:N4-gp56 family major capsid protein
MMEKTRNDIITALGSINGTAYASADATARNAWLVDNSDRVLFGALIANAVSGVHATALATLDTTDDKFTASKAALMKRIALAANPKIRPITVDGGKRVYVVFCGLRTFRDLQTSLEQINREALQRGMDNPIITGADLHYDGMVFKQVDDMPVYEDVGSGGTVDVSPVYLCGAQALGVAYAKRTTSKTEEFDYGDKNGVAIEEIRGIKKMIFGSGSSDTADTKDHGVVTGYFAAPPDA